MMPGPIKEKVTGLQDGYFTKTFPRIFEKESYTDPISNRRKERLVEKKKNVSTKPFISFSGEKKPWVLILALEISFHLELEFRNILVWVLVLYLVHLVAKLTTFHLKQKIKNHTLMKNRMLKRIHLKKELVMGKLL